MEEEPKNGEFVFLNHEYPYWGNILGRNRTVEYDKGKFNRYAKLGVISDELIKDFANKVKTNPKSTEGRCAYASLLMMMNGIRIGNEGSAEGYVSGLKQNKGEVVQTFGTTTLRNEHIEFKDGTMHLDFLGKEQVHHDIKIKDKFLVKYGKVYHDQSRPEDKWIGIDYDTLFKFTKENVGDGFIPKDFRTFCANLTAWKVIEEYLNKPKAETKTDANQEIKDVVAKVARRLGNTPGIAKRAYIDNRMLDWFKEQRLEIDD